MGKSSSATVGYWYKVLYHAGLGIGPFDAFLEFRGGDKTAWSGWLASSGTISINAPNLWGGEKDQGGIVGDVDVMFGEATQVPSPYLLANLGPQVPAWRGMATLVFKGGKYGAMNPYPQKASYKICKITKGWDTDPCWYPGKAVIALSPESGNLTIAIAIGPDTRPSADGEDWSRVTDPAPFVTGYAIGAGGDAFVAWNVSNAMYTTDAGTWHPSTGFLGGSGGFRQGVYFGGSVVIAGGINGYYASSDKGQNFNAYAYPDFPRLNFLAASPTLLVGANQYDTTFKTSPTATGPWAEGGVHNLIPRQMDYGPGYFVLVGSDLTTLAPKAVRTIDGIAVAVISLPAFATAAYLQGVAFSPGGLGVIVADNGELAYMAATGVWSLSADVLGETARGVSWVGDRFIAWGATVAKQSTTGEVWAPISLGMTNVAAIATGATIDDRVFGLRAANPAHVLYYARTHSDIGREPTANINDASYRAAADTLHAEGFGICTSFDPQAESLEEFEQRICKLIGGSVSRDIVDGQWHLDLARGDYVLAALPILTDDDILDFSEQPSTLDGVVNSLSVKYFDPERKEDIVTPPVQALALIDAFGTVHQANEYLEIPIAALAARVADRDLRTTVTPTRAFELTTTRKPYAWRPNQYFRLQAPKRGIADMVCILGEKQSGTLRSGAMKLKATQDIYSLPTTTFVEAEPGVDTRPPQTPVPIVLQHAFEAPYIDVAAALSRADLQALPAEVGYLLAVAADPAVSRDYTLAVATAGGDYVVQANGEWCSTAIVVEAASAAATAFSLSSARSLAEVSVGMPALWGNEVVRVDAIDAVANTVSFARGCGDTVPQAHAAGERVWFYGSAAAADTTEYTDGETISAKLLTNTGSQQLEPALASPLVVTFDQRAARPYPPARIRVNGEAWPSLLAGVLTVAWAHRDRVLQADQVIDNEAASIGLEAGATVTVRWFLDGVLVQTHSGLTGTSQDYAPPESGPLRVELETIRDGLTSWQMQIREFFYTPSLSTLLLMENGSAIETEGGEPIELE